jgi:hypothetical protein
MSTQYAPIYEGDSLIHHAPARFAATTSPRILDGILDALVALLRRIDRAWINRLERERERRIETALAGAGDLYEVERRLVTIQRSGLL